MQGGREGRGGKGRDGEGSGGEGGGGKGTGPKPTQQFLTNVHRAAYRASVAPATSDQRTLITKNVYILCAYEHSFPELAAKTQQSD